MSEANMKFDEAVEIISGISDLKPSEMSGKDQLAFAAAYLAFAEMMKPFYEKYVRPNKMDGIDELIRAYLDERGGK